jgi:hypothetical protein
VNKPRVLTCLDLKDLEQSVQAFEVKSPAALPCNIIRARYSQLGSKRPFRQIH